MSKNTQIAFSFLIVILLVGGSFYYLSRSKKAGNIAPITISEPAATNTAPAVPDTSGWKTFSDSANKISFKYPAGIDTQFISVVDWPPKVQITDGPFTCTEAGTETGQAGQTSRQTIDGRDYCVTRESEGAAGSTYTQYAYATKLPQLPNKTVIFTFSLRFVQCDNYDEPQKTSCKEERASFDIGPVVGAMARSVAVPQ